MAAILRAQGIGGAAMALAQLWLLSIGLSIFGFCSSQNPMDSPLYYGPHQYDPVAYGEAIVKSFSVSNVSFSLRFDAKYGLAIFRHYSSSPVWGTSSEVVVWGASMPGWPYGTNTSLHFIEKEGLQLVAAANQSNVLWSSNTSSLSPMGFQLLHTGNMILVDSSNRTVWQSFSYPLSILLPGQIMTHGMKLLNGAYELVMEAGGLALYKDMLPQYIWSLAAETSTDGAIPPSTNSMLALKACESLTRAVFSPLAEFYMEEDSVAAAPSKRSKVYCNALGSRRRGRLHATTYSLTETVGENRTHYIELTYFGVLAKKDTSSNIYQSYSEERVQVGSVPWVRLIAFVGVVGCFCVFLIYLLLKKSSKELVETEEEAFLDSLPGLPPRLSYKEIQDATKEFAKELGAGGFGRVYFGTLKDGSLVAVKNLEGVRQGKKEFRAEVATIGSIHHLNLVRLCGFCIEGSHRLLVYEFMENGSLDRWLFSTSETCLDWSTRYTIALHTAKGLAYLHEDCCKRILHLDIKPQNILLDAKFRAKVSDFGLAKLVGREVTHVCTTMRGTPGYLAPEWLYGAITEKTDVYSYGILLLQLISGRRLFDSLKDLYIVTWASKLVEEDQLLQIVDQRVHADGLDMEQVVTMVYIALWCVQHEESMRLSMEDVVLALEGFLKIPNPPCHSSPPRYYRPSIEGGSSSEDILICSTKILGHLL